MTRIGVHHWQSLWQVLDIARGSARVQMRGKTLGQTPFVVVVALAIASVPAPAGVESGGVEIPRLATLDGFVGDRAWTAASRTRCRYSNKRNWWNPSGNSRGVASGGNCRA